MSNQLPLSKFDALTVLTFKVKMVSRCVAWLDTFHGDPCPIGSTLELWRNCNSHFTPPRYGHTTKISLHCYRVWSKMGRFSSSLGRKLNNHRSPPLPKSLRIICVYTYNIFSRARIYCSYQIRLAELRILSEWNFMFFYANVAWFFLRTIC